VAALEGDDYDGDGGSDCQDGAQQPQEDLDNSKISTEEVEEHDYRVKNGGQPERVTPGR
jgi:hypothetical protein